jgi:hypothetical protein
LAWLLRKAGVNVPQAPIGGSDWAQNAGLMAEPKNKNSLASLLGDAAGNIAPILGYAKAPEIAGGINQMIRNANAPTPFNNAKKGQLGAVVWHGSPHKFDAFDASKIGTGEGAQAYGHGLYLAESPKVAKDYQIKLSKPDFTTMSDGSNISSGLQNLLSDSYSYLSKRQPNVTRFDAIQDVVEQIPKNSPFYKEAQQALRYPPKEGGSLYKVDLPDEQIAKMLDYDNPVSDAFRKPLSDAAMNQFGTGLTGTSGEKLYKDVIFNFKQAGHPNPTQAATDWLTQQGVPGMKYLDGGSRGAGAGTQNFVVFPKNESLLKILSRNGQDLGK